MKFLVLTVVASLSFLSSVSANPKPSEASVVQSYSSMTIAEWSDLVADRINQISQDQNVLDVLAPLMNQSDAGSYESQTATNQLMIQKLVAGLTYLASLDQRLTFGEWVNNQGGMAMVTAAIANWYDLLPWHWGSSRGRRPTPMVVCQDIHGTDRIIYTITQCNQCVGRNVCESCVRYYRGDPTRYCFAR